MLSQVSYIKTLITPSEQDALILENSLIKSLKPKYNILLRDDKTYPYIFADLSEDFPTLAITRTTKRDNIAQQDKKEKNIIYFGPFSSGARDLLEGVLESVCLVQKKSCLKGKKACLFYQMKSCLAPCEGKISKQDYAKILQNALKLLQDKKKLAKVLESKMQIFAQNFAYEEAAKMRDRISKIAQMQNGSSIDLADSSNLDVFVFVQEKTTAKKGIVMKLFVRDGRVVSSDSFLVYELENLDGISPQILHSIYTQTLLNHYKTKTPLLPDSILLPSDFGCFEDKQKLEQILHERMGKKIQILQPKRGKKADLITLAQKNALEILNKEEQQSLKEVEVLEQIQQLLGLDEIPYRIETFDTSHHSGRECVGAMVVYENGSFKKTDFRRFHLQGSDEYSQMNEMLTRRALDFAHNPPPNLWLLDGGIAQLKLAQEILKSSGVEIGLLAISKHKLNGRAHRAKGNAQDVLHAFEGSGKSMSYKLIGSDKRLQFFQKLRDEAHRFAIAFHRKQKSKTVSQLNILGSKLSLKPAQMARLLKVFGSSQVIESLSLEQITNALRKRDSR